MYVTVQVVTWFKCETSYQVRVRGIAAVIWDESDLVRIGDIGTAVAGVSHSISVPVQLVPVLDPLAVIQEVL